VSNKADWMIKERREWKHSDKLNKSFEITLFF